MNSKPSEIAQIIVEIDDESRIIDAVDPDAGSLTEIIASYAREKFPNEDIQIGRVLKDTTDEAGQSKGALEAIIASAPVIAALSPIIVELIKIYCKRQAETRETTAKGPDDQSVTKITIELKQ